MKKIALAVATVATLVATTSVFADGWRVMPVLSDSKLKFEPTLALTVNSVDPDERGVSAATAYGIDLNFNCGLIQDPQNRIRTHLNVSRSDKAGLEVMAYELSPRYTVPLGNGVSVGVGPSLAVFNLESAGYNESHIGLGLAAGVNVRMGQFYAGADLRYHDTNTKRGVDYDSLSLGAKVGINF